MNNIVPGMDYEGIKATKHANVKGYAIGKLLQKFEPRIQWNLISPAALSGSFRSEVTYEFENFGKKRIERKECNVVDIIRLVFELRNGRTVFDLWKEEKYDEYFKHIEYIKNKVREGDFSVFPEYLFNKDRNGDWFTEGEAKEVSKTLVLVRANGAEPRLFKNFTPAILSRIADHVENKLRTELIEDAKMKTVEPIEYYDDFFFD